MCVFPLGVYPPAGSSICVCFHWGSTSQLVQYLCVFPLGVYLPAGPILCVFHWEFTSQLVHSGVSSTGSLPPSWFILVCLPLGVYLPAGSSIKCVKSHPNVPVLHSNLRSGRSKRTVWSSIRPSIARHHWSRLSHCQDQQTWLQLLLISKMRLLRQNRSETRGDNSVVQIQRTICDREYKPTQRPKPAVPLKESGRLLPAHRPTLTLPRGPRLDHLTTSSIFGVQSLPRVGRRRLITLPSPRRCYVQPRSIPTERTSSLASPYPTPEWAMEVMTFCF